MIIYLTPQDGSGRVVMCDSIESVNRAIALFKAQGTTEIHQSRGDVVCDFCSHPEIVALYQVTPGGIIHQFADETHADSDGRWGACSICNQMISAREWIKLRDRSVDTFLADNPEIKNHPLGLNITRQSVNEAHVLFRKMWDGSPSVPVQSDRAFLNGHGIEY